MTPPTQSKPEEAPVDGWNLRNLKDTRENIVELINSAEFVPPTAKAFLVAHVDALPFAVRLVKVDAHCHLVHGAMVINASVGPL
jgi:hypothetical protein